MRIVKLPDGYVVYYETETWTVPAHILHSLFRAGALRQRERDALLARNFTNAKPGGISDGVDLGALQVEMMRAIRAQPISDTDIAAALEGK